MPSFIVSPVAKLNVTSGLTKKLSLNPKPLNEAGRGGGRQGRRSAGEEAGRGGGRQGRRPAGEEGRGGGQGRRAGQEGRGGCDGF